MPAVVYKKPDSFTGAVEAATGYLSGKVAGEENLYQRRQAAAAQAEDTRRFEATTANAIQDRKQAFGEEVRQFDANEQFRRDNLKFLGEEGLAERNLKQTLQTEDLGAQKERLGMQLTQSNVENTRDNRTRAYGIKKQAEADQTRLDLQRTELQGQEQKLQFAQTIRGKYGDPKLKPYTSQQWEQIKQEGRIRWLGSGAVSGQQDVVQATPDQIAQIDRMTESTVMGYDTLQTQVTNDAISYADGMASTEAKYRGDSGGGNSGGRTGGDRGGIRIDQMFDPNESAVDSLTGQRLLSDDVYQQLTTEQAEILAGLDEDIQMSYQTVVGMDKFSIESTYEQHNRRIKDLLSGADFQGQHPQFNRSLQDYYTDRLKIAMYIASQGGPVPEGGEP